jgi:soluble lytic murein transglycosylase
MSARTLGSTGTRRPSALARGAVLVIAVALVVFAASELQKATRRMALPLTHASVIREQAAAERLDPALVAAVIYAESKFDPRPSRAGAQGLMQILPATAYYLAHLSGGSSFTSRDLATPRINVAYGSYYLRYLLDHYNGAETLALAAYNGGMANVDKWAAHAHAEGSQLTIEGIPFPETREYVQRVLSARRAYRAAYPHQLGLR